MTNLKHILGSREATDMASSALPAK